MNIAELVLAQRELRRGQHGFALLIERLRTAASSAVRCSERATPTRTGLRRRYLVRSRPDLDRPRRLGRRRRPSPSRCSPSPSPASATACSWSPTGSCSSGSSPSASTAAPSGCSTRRLLGLRRRPARRRADRHDRRQPHHLRPRRRRHPARLARRRPRPAHAGAPDHPRPCTRMTEKGATVPTAPADPPPPPRPRKGRTPCRPACAEHPARHYNRGANRASAPAEPTRPPRRCPATEEHAMPYRTR